MRWLTFLLLMVIALTLQSALAPRLEVFGVRPDWLLVVVVFFAMHATARDATFGAWLIGGCADLLTVERLGLLALSYGLAALAVLSVREYLFRHRVWPQFLVTLGACLLIRLAWTVYCRALYDPAGSLWVDLMGGIVMVSLYTALWAPVVHWVLLPMWRTLGLPRPRTSDMGPW